MKQRATRFFFTDLVYGSCTKSHNHYRFEKEVDRKMREKMQKQLPLMDSATDHDQAWELEAIDAILKKHPTICDLVYQNLCQNMGSDTCSGARGMSAEQVLRSAIVKALFGFTYKQLAFHLVVSHSLRRFCLIGIADKGSKKSVLNKNI